MRVCFIVFLSFVFYQATAQLAENVVRTEEELAISVEDDDEPANEEACATARNLEGICVVRERCDYGPGAIDFTLYAPSWYKRPCEADEVCCPPEYLVEVAATPRPFDSFEFDDDD